MLNKKDKNLLVQLQDQFPFDPRPYAVIARRLGLTPAFVKKRVAFFRQKGIIRYIGAVLDTKRIGLKSSLVALAVPVSRIKEVSGIINSYSEVTHNYLRDDKYNMWFTVSARTEKKRAALIREIREKTEIPECLDLSTVRVFKIDARFALGRNAPPFSANAPRGTGKERRAVSPRINRRVLAALPSLAVPLDDSDRPLQAISRRLGCTERSVALLLEAGVDKKLIRRFGAVLDHYKIGLKT
ncbi:MAG: hypothetical protein WCY10_05880, partial [Candidatus Omnitrophota bacterium]